MADRERRGFTLVEMLVALAVFSLAALALLNLSGENTRAAVRMETRTLGGIVAENLVVETMMAPDLPPGVSSGTVELAGRPWRWTRAVRVTDDPGIIRILIVVEDAAGRAADRTIFRSARS